MNNHSRVWSLQEAKAKFSEVVRRAQSEGPQTVTVHGKAAVTIVPAPSEEAAARAPRRDFVAAMQACPFKEDGLIVAEGEPMEIGEAADL